MTLPLDMTPPLAPLRRPRTLTRAARRGLDDYRRDRDLRRLFRVPTTPAPRQAVAWLLEAERETEARRAAGSPGYDPVRHLELLIALMAELRVTSAA